MPPLTIVSSDQPDTLVERLALDLARAPLGPFDEEVIVVQSRGTERWIRHELARRHGCQPITLGPIILRVETAAIYCLSVLSYELLI